jgi:3-deoxy-manno-octulosonate cytidylyltransferase (CMP-KDO synthetase)
MNKIVAIIPSRYQSSRFSGKSLALICNKPMIQWVYEAVEEVERIDAVYVATDDERIYNTVEGVGANLRGSPSPHVRQERGIENETGHDNQR